MSIYDGMIINNIIDFTKWLYREKGITRLEIKNSSYIRELAKEYIKVHYPEGA